MESTSLKSPTVEAIDCVDDGSSIQSMCQASLIKSPASTCSLPGLRTTGDQISGKSRQAEFLHLELQCLELQGNRNFSNSLQEGEGKVSSIASCCSTLTYGGGRRSLPSSYMFVL
ncbi:unnamed protein product [Linum trigynum]|uniref:Uncharacterized protein n=1 Tax=Linum trigynum TaxID=586398 RepID=A0AAV2GSC3_9ROSI